MSWTPDKSFPPVGQPPAAPPKPEVGLPTADERTWALLAHLSFLAGGVVGLPPLGPLVVWLLKKDESPFVGDQAKEALNFQLAVLIVSVICAVTIILLPLAILIGIGALVFGIIAALEANKGVLYRYPYTIRLIK